MKKEPILIIFLTKGGNKYCKDIDRQKFYDLMNSVKLAFEYDNRISKFFCEIIPEVNWIEIHKERNDQLDVPFIEYNIDGVSHHILEIKRHHKVIWSILDQYAKIEK